MPPAHPTDSSTPPSAPLGMTPSSSHRTFTPAERATWPITLSSRPRERSAFSICHPDRESEAPFQSVIPTERAERTSGGIYGAATGKASTFRRQSSVMTASVPKQAHEQAEEPQRHRRHGEAQGFFQRNTLCTSAAPRLCVSALTFFSYQVSPQTTKAPAVSFYLC